ncbi:hypothetical protein [Massilia glaciei]|uniref:Uncharacterized protein n=1 Tax=Massilia glaciei TaxID=1524097 RepID=A0A2U2HG71_9BURK|nr:hypothetical protein [Massilia glaciei]PWF43699.1 hypothetical protein C7C56_020630 [Massilia glaciei]
MNKLVRCAAWYQIWAGGFVAFISALMLFLTGSNGADIAFEGQFVVIGLIGMCAGIALLAGSVYGWLGSVLFQLWQIPVFAFGSVLYRPGVGLFIPVGADLPATGGASLLYEFTLGLDFSMAFVAVPQAQFAAVNAVALALLMVLLFNRPTRLGQNAAPARLAGA